MVKTQCSHWRGHWFDSWLGKEVPKCCVMQEKKKNCFFKKRKNKEKLFISAVIMKQRKILNLPHLLIKINKVGISTESMRKQALSFSVSGIVN